MTDPQALEEDLSLASPNLYLCLSLNAITSQQMHIPQVHRLLLNEIIKPLCREEPSKATWWKMGIDWNLGLIIQYLHLESFKDVALLSLLSCFVLFFLPCFFPSLVTILGCRIQVYRFLCASSQDCCMAQGAACLCWGGHIWEEGWQSQSRVGIAP